MNEEIKRHIAARAELIAQAKKITDKATAEKRSMTAEENTSFQKMWADADSHKATLEAIQKNLAAEAELSQTAGRKTDAETPGAKVPKPAQDMMKALCAKFMDKKDERVKRLLDNMPAELNADYMELLRKSILQGSDNQFGGEMRRLEAASRKSYQIDVPSQGGYLLPVEVSAQILLKLLDKVYIRGAATVLPLNSYAAEIPSLDVEPDQPEPSGEVSEMAEEAGGTLGRRMLKPHLLPIVVKIARDLLHFSPSFEGVLIDRIQRGFGIKEEKLFMTGTGSGQPLGLFTTVTSSYGGISAARNVVCGSATNPTLDGIIAAFMNQKKQYRDNSSWMLSRAFVQKTLSLKDNMGQPIWRPGMLLGAPDMLYGRAVLESEYVPNTFTASKAVGMFGDMSYYWIAQVMGFEVQPLLEKYATTNELGFACRQWVDGMPMLDEAFSRLTLGA